MDNHNTELRDILADVQRMSEQLYLANESAASSAAEVARLRAEIDRLSRILAALREPSEAVVESMLEKWGLIDALRAAVAAAEQEVGRE